MDKYDVFQFTCVRIPIYDGSDAHCEAPAPSAQTGKALVPEVVRRNPCAFLIAVLVHAIEWAIGG